jgi:hypothetical protein
MFKVYGDSPNDNLQYILRMCDEGVDTLMKALDKMEFAMQMKMFTFSRSGDDEADEGFWKILDDVLQGGLMKSLERYRDQVKPLSIKYGITKDEKECAVWLNVRRKDDEEDDKASLEVVPEEEPTH